MKRIVIIMALFALTLISFGQKLIEGQSKVTKVKFTPDYKRDLPPNLFADLKFSDDNNNGILEAGESAKIQIVISNKGKGPAQGLVVKIKDSFFDPQFIIEDKKDISLLYPGETATILIPLKAGIDIKTAEHRLEIVVNEYFGFDMDPAYLVLNSFEYQKPRLEFSGLEIIDYGEGTGAIISDRQLQAGEQVKMKIVFQNVGDNTAYDTKYKIFTNDENIFMENISGSIGNLEVGEVKEIWLTLTPNKKVKTDNKLPIYLTLSSKYGKGNLEDFQLPVYLNQKTSAPVVKEVHADIESLAKKIARFETQSQKITTRVENLINIDEVNTSISKRDDCVAIIMGVEKYTNLPPAPYASKDAEIMKKYFENRLGIKKENIFIYTDEEVSGLIFDGIFNPSYGDLQKAIIKGKTDIFVFYSGHGIPDKSGQNIYLFPSDGKVEQLELAGYNINKFYKNLESLQARNVTVFIDACFSGASRASENHDEENLVDAKGILIAPKIYSPWQNNNNFSVFTSSSGYETSLGFDQTQTGLFTYFLCAGLNGKADANNDHMITMKELKDYVKQNVLDVSVKIRGKQTPEFFGNENMVLVEY